MPWAFVRPADPRVLSGRPLLDLGTGDAQTLGAVAEGNGIIVGVDHSIDALRAARSSTARLVCAEAEPLPFADESFATVLAGDLFHHMDNTVLPTVVEEIRRVLRDGGRLVAWWYENPGRPAPDAPRHPRSFDVVRHVVEAAGLAAEELELEFPVATPPTAGLIATR